MSDFMNPKIGNLTKRTTRKAKSLDEIFSKEWKDNGKELLAKWKSKDNSLDRNLALLQSRGAYCDSSSDFVSLTGSTAPGRARYAATPTPTTIMAAFPVA